MGNSPLSSHDNLSKYWNLFDCALCWSNSSLTLKLSLTLFI